MVPTVGPRGDLMTNFAPGTPTWVDLSTSDLEATKQFYGGLFGWTAETGDQEQYGGYTTFYKDGKAVAAAAPLMGEGQPVVWTTYFATDDADAVAKRVESAGGKVIAPPMDVPPHGRMAVFFDQAGAGFAVWQAAEMKGAELVGEPGAFGWAELMTRDPEGSKAFYSAVLGVGSRDVSYEGVTYTLWEVGGQPVAGMMPMEGEMWPPELPPHWMVYFTVEDCDASAARVAELDGTVSVPPTDTAAGRFAVVSDPQGAFFSIIKSNPDFQP